MPNFSITQSATHGKWCAVELERLLTRNESMSHETSFCILTQRAEHTWHVFDGPL